MRAWPERISRPGEHPPADAVLHFVVYRHPSDYPAGYVVRRWWLDPQRQENVAEAEWFARGATLQSVRSAIPYDMVCLHRMPDDDPAIYEVWM